MNGQGITVTGNTAACAFLCRWLEDYSLDLLMVQDGVHIPGCDSERRMPKTYV
jgi:hypothetical protein